MIGHYDNPSLQIAVELDDMGEALKFYESVCKNDKGVVQPCYRCSVCHCIIIDATSIDRRVMHLMTHHGWTMDGQHRE